MSPMSRAIWLLARLGAEAEKREEVAPLLGGPEATSEDKTQADVRSSSCFSNTTTDLCIPQPSVGGD